MPLRKSTLFKTILKGYVSFLFNTSDPSLQREFDIDRDNARLNKFIDLVALINLLKQKSTREAQLSLALLKQFFEQSEVIRIWVKEQNDPTLLNLFNGRTISSNEFDILFQPFYAALDITLREIYDHHINHSYLEPYFAEYDLLRGDTLNKIEAMPERLSLLQERGRFYGADMLNVRNAQVFLYFPVLPMTLVFLGTLTAYIIERLATASAFGPGTAGVSYIAAVLVVGTLSLFSYIARAHNRCEAAHEATRQEMKRALENDYREPEIISTPQPDADQGYIRSMITHLFNYRSSGTGESESLLPPSDKDVLMRKLSSNSRTSLSV